MSIYLSITDEDDKIDQGDIYIDIFSPTTSERVNAVVITPACDLEQNKAAYIKFVVFVSFNEIVLELLKKHSKLSEDDFESPNVLSRKKYDSAINTLFSNINGDLYPRYYLVPAYSEEFPESFIDLQHVFTISTQEVYEKYMSNRLAKIASPWREQIVTRYNGYSVRVGTPDYSEQDLRILLEKLGLNLPPVKE